jgi:hypothetical protein
MAMGMVLSGQPGSKGAALKAAVEAEEDVYSYEPANNGAGPLWCHGSTCLIRVGDDVFASGLETLHDARPLNNCRWTLLKRGTNGWKLIPTQDQGRTREPSPLAAFPDGRFFLSANPTLLTNRETYSGPARPELLEFDARQPGEFRRLEPVWDGAPRFTEHSYRSLAADGEGRELILLQNIDYTHAEWSFLDRSGKWSAQGKLKWRVEDQKPIRLGYPNVALKNRAVHFCGTSDIVEPNQEWRAYKKQLTGREWDYTFRRLFYTWTSDITTTPFHEWIEIANVDSTGGGITLGDLWLAPDGAVHLLWTERKLDESLRDKFFREQRQRYTLIHAVLRDGGIVSRQVLLEAQEGGAGEVPGRGRFQMTPENRLFAVFYVSGSDAKGRGVSENRILDLKPDGSTSEPLRLALKHPMSEFMTATVRAGSPRSHELEMFGQTVGSGNTISYARVRLE